MTDSRAADGQQYEPQDQAQDQRQAAAPQASQAPQANPHPPADDVDGLKDKKPEDLTPDELRLMADTMPGEGPGD